MEGLKDTFGEDFAEQVEQKIQKRREQRERIDEESKKKIADMAVNQGYFHDGDPTFDYTDDEGITHDVMLMQLAEPREGSVWNQVRRMDSGGISVPLDYLGEWVWSIFNDESMAKKMDEGEWYIVAGNLTTWEPDDGEPQDQFSPVRGVISMEEAKELASDSMEEEGFGSASSEDTSEDTTEDEPGTEDDGSSEGSLFSDDGDSEEEEEKDAPYIEANAEDVYNIVESLAEEEGEVWDVHEDHDEFPTLLMVVCDKLGVDYEEEQARDEVAELVLERVEMENEEDDEEEEEEDSLFSA